ncbi:sugar ABC transporter permease [bacterium]|nr:sugar ABC transporter permease [candidate division CSSED10-310 bacterium]
MKKYRFIGIFTALLFSCTVLYFLGIPSHRWYATLKTRYIARISDAYLQSEILNNRESKPENALKSLQQACPLIKTAIVVKQNRYLLHVNTDRINTPFDPRNLFDKEMYDLLRKLKFGYGNDGEAFRIADFHGNHSGNPGYLYYGAPLTDEHNNPSGLIHFIVLDDTEPPWLLPLAALLILSAIGGAASWAATKKIIASLHFFILATLGIWGFFVLSPYETLWQPDDSQQLHRIESGLISMVSDPPQYQQLLQNDSLIHQITSDAESILKTQPKLPFFIRILPLLAGVLVYWFFYNERALSAYRAVKRHRTAYAYIMPAMTGMIILVAIPLIYGVILAFMQIKQGEWTFVGLDNFVAILSDFSITKPDNFYFTLAVTVLWTVSNVCLHVFIGLSLALILNRPTLKLKRFYRVLLILPWAIPNYITALIWKGMFHRQFGAVNAMLNALGSFYSKSIVILLLPMTFLVKAMLYPLECFYSQFGEVNAILNELVSYLGCNHIGGISWFKTFWPAFTANLTTNVWLGFPFMMVVSLGALQSIPGELYEAASIDGASRYQQFKHITLPLLKSALFPAIILGTIWTFNMFNIIYLVSGGAPEGATDILIVDAYRWAFEKLNYGYAAAYSLVIFFVLFLYSAITNRITHATEGAFD